MENLSITELQTMMAKQQKELADRIIAADQEIAARKALHEAEMAKEKAAIDEFHRTKAAERSAKKAEDERLAAEKAKSDLAAALMQEQSDNARAEDEKRVREHLKLLQQRAAEIEVLEEQLKRTLAAKITNSAYEQPEGEPAPEEMSAHLRRLLHMDNRDTIGLERPEQYEKTL